MEVEAPRTFKVARGFVVLVSNQDFESLIDLVVEGEIGLIDTRVALFCPNEAEIENNNYYYFKGIERLSVISQIKSCNSALGKTILSLLYREQYFKSNLLPSYIIAKLINLRRETFSRNLTLLKKKGWISYAKCACFSEIKIVDAEAMQQHFIKLM